MESQNFSFSAYSWNRMPMDEGVPHPQLLSHFLHRSDNTQAIGPSVTAERPSELAQAHNHGNESSGAANAVETSAKRKRRKYDNLDWDAHQAELRKLYLEQKNTLEDTMLIMKENHSFVASKKLYKLQFQKWSWHKNLPATHSHFMVNKARERRNNENKATEFTYGGQKWDQDKAYNSLLRSKKAAMLADTQDVPTPSGIEYETPQNNAPSPIQDSLRGSMSADESDGDVSEEDCDEYPAYLQGSSDGDDEENAVSVMQHQGNVPSIREVGLARQYLHMLELARQCKQEGKMKEAEEKFWDAIQGLDQVMGPAHEDTKKAKYECANFFAEAGRMQDADVILDDLTSQHIAAYGHEHRTTQKHVLYSIELLETWGRPTDAFGLLSRSKYIMDTNSRNSKHSNGKRREPATRPQCRSGRNLDIEAMAKRLGEGSSPAMIIYGLGVAKSHVQANDEASEILLQAIIRHCREFPQGLDVQHLQALAELVKLCQRLGRIPVNVPLLAQAEITIKTIWDSYDWFTERFQCVEIMEAAMQLAANILKAGFKDIATRMFRRIQDKASDTFGYNDERTVWISISIGQAYQNHTSWNDAWEWFEAALAATLSDSHKWPSDDGIVRSLSNAIAKSHFTYLSDEGRPFKTIFGVSGLTIRPGRLQLE